MAESEENDNKEKEIPSETGSLGSAKRADPFAPHADIRLSKETLEARQAAIGQKRKYAGPVSEEAQEEEVTRREAKPSDVPPTDCAEPPEGQE